MPWGGPQGAALSVSPQIWNATLVTNPHAEMSLAHPAKHSLPLCRTLEKIIGYTLGCRSSRHLRNQSSACPGRTVHVLLVETCVKALETVSSGYFNISDVPPLDFVGITARSPSCCSVSQITLTGVHYQSNSNFPLRSVRIAVCTSGFA